MGIFYKAWALDDATLRKSSSGGVFSILASYVLDHGGVVYGACQERDNALRHIAVTEAGDLDRIRKSKYYQSDFSQVFSGAKEYLEEGRMVLVSGTACQIQALHCYLRSAKVSEENLLTVDVLCHGVSNARVFERYLQSQRKRYEKKIDSVSFRTKGVPWEKGGGTSMEFRFEDGASKIIPWKKDSYYLAFNNDLSLRPSCYSCHFVGMERVSDFTLADFWGIKREMADEKHLKLGVGLVVANTQKAEQLMKSAYFTDRCFIEQIDPKTATPYNAAFHTRRKCHKNRERFFRNVFQADFNQLVRSCLAREIVIYRLKAIYHAIKGK